MKKSVILRAPTLTQSGYGVHARQIARWLLSKPELDVKFHLLPWGDTPWLLDSDAYDGLVGEVMKRSVNDKARADVSLQLQLPNEWDTAVAGYNVGMTAGVETNKCNPLWIQSCNKMSRLIVPSQHVVSNLSSTGTINVPLSVVPESYTDAVALSYDRLPKLQSFSTPFNFLVFGQITGNNPYNDRKNTFFTLKWLCETFKDDKDVGIVIKTNAGRNTKIDKNVCRGILQGILNEARKGPYPRVHFLHGDMNDYEVASLYKHPQIKALVTLTRGEGYGLPILEAAASGLPVIATDWSGHLDFLRHGKYISIYYQLGDVHQSRIDNQIFVPGMKWANPSEEDFKKRITKFRSSNYIPKQWATELEQKLLKAYSFESIANQYNETLKDVI